MLNNVNTSVERIIVRIERDFDIVHYIYKIVNTY